MDKKKFATHKALTVLLLTIIIFGFGIVVGNYNTSKKFNQVIGLSRSIETQTLGVEVIHEILKENLCEGDNVLYLNDDLYILSERLEYMEGTLGVSSEDIRELKNEYFIIEARHWTLAKRRAKECLDGAQNITNTIILYFYSDDDGVCPRCKEQGSVLTYLREKYPGMKIYSFDIDSGSSVVNVIKKLYDVEGVPGLVINDETHVGYLDADDIIEFVDVQTEGSS